MNKSKSGNNLFSSKKAIVAQTTDFLHALEFALSTAKFAP
jgi:hypothetical protein